MSRPALTLLLLALACGGGGEQRPATGPQASEWFPLVEGATWVYDVRSELGSFQVEVEAKGDMVLPQGKGTVFVMDETNLGPALGFAESAPVGYLIEGEFLARWEALDYDGKGELRILGQDVATRIFPTAGSVGEVWGQSTRMFGTPEGGGAEVGWSGEVKPRTSLDVPAGHFEDVLEVRTTYTEGDSATPKIIYHDYYVRGVGLVRSVTEDPSGDTANRIEQVLVRYSFP